MSEQRVNDHTVSRLTVHIVWSTKYRYPVLRGDVQKECRKLLIQICDAEDINILKGVASNDHVHMHIEYRPSQNISTIVKKLKGRGSRKLQEQFPEIRKALLGQAFLGYRLWLLEYGKYNGQNGERIS